MFRLDFGKVHRNYSVAYRHQLSPTLRLGLVLNLTYENTEQSLVAVLLWPLADDPPTSSEKAHVIYGERIIVIRRQGEHGNEAVIHKGSETAPHGVYLQAGRLHQLGEARVVGTFLRSSRAIA
jgi:hypothetical protein